MSVIIRLQNLPWSANALDIRQFFKGLSIPEGGVHIVGGELGDAFIAFSTDEDARQAMMHDRDCIKEIQVRLLLSSRAEMQKVIENARIQSISLYQQLAARAGGTVAAVPGANVKAPAIQPSMTPNIFSGLNVNKLPSQQQPSGPTPSFLAYQQQAGITVTGAPIVESATSMKGNNDDRIRERENRRSPSIERGSRYRNRRDSGSRSRSRERDRDNDRGRSREQERDSKGRRYDRSRRSNSKSSRDSRDRSLERSRSRNTYSRNARQSESRDPDRSNKESNGSSWSGNGSIVDNDKSKSVPVQSWSTSPINSYQSNQYQSTVSNAYSTLASKENSAPTAASGAAKSTPEVIIPAFQNYSSTVTNNYSINLFGGSNSNSNSSDSSKPFVLQNPYTTAQHSSTPPVDSKPAILPTPLAATAIPPKPTIPAATTKLPLNSSGDLLSSRTTGSNANNFQGMGDEPIAFAKTNPYEQMYPSLFAQAAAQSMPRSNATAAQRSNSPSYKAREPETNAFPEASSIKISNMCGSTNYSDLRKFFSGLFIPHNGIKMVNDKYGLRIGVAYIQFSRQSSVLKAMTRNNAVLKSKNIKIEPVTDEEFNEAEDSYRPSGRFGRQNHDGSSDDRYDNNSQSYIDFKNPFRKFAEEPTGPFTVLYIEELPPLTTEQDIMKMFSSYTIYDMLLTPSAENRREYVAHVKFSLADDAKAALEDKSRHMIGYRKVRVQPGTDEDMEKAKEKLRLANEQLKKEEEEEAARNAATTIIDLDELPDPLPTEQYENGIDTSRDDDVISPPTAMRVSNRDPRLNDPRHIPSLFDMPASKPPMDEDDNKSVELIPPTDPRLDPRRTRSRPSRFDNDTRNNNNLSNPPPNINLNSNNTNSNPQMPLPMPNQFVGNNNNHTFNDMPPFAMNPMEQNFVLLYNCPYSARNNDIGEMFVSANLPIKHVEMLSNERGMPAGEFIIEVTNPRDADTAIKDFHNMQFHGRTLRARQIKPQEIADRLHKPFMNYLPGGNGIAGGNNFNFNNGNLGGGVGGVGPMMGGGGMRGIGGGGNDMQFNGNNNMNGMRGGVNNGGNSPPRYRRGMQQQRSPYGGGRNGRGNGGGRNNCDDIGDDIDYNDDDMGGRNNRNMGNGGGGGDGGGSDGIPDNSGGIPEKFNRPECVLVVENVPYKADSDDILRFFGNYKLRGDDIIRRFNDDGTPTGDARVAFATADDARDAYEKLNRKQIFNRTIYLNIL